MPITVKVMLSIGATGLVLAALLIGKVDALKRSRSLWRGGVTDPIRRLVSHPDGTPREGFRLVLVLLLALWLVAIWSAA